MTAYIRTTMMSDGFTTLWNKRLSSNPENQAQLYLAIEAIAKHSKCYFYYNEHNRGDFFQSFYEEKILKAIHNKKVITTPEYDDCDEGLIYKMLINYHNDCYRKRQNEGLTPQNRIDINAFETPDTSDEKDFKPLSIEEKKQLFEPIETPFPFDDMVEEAIKFIYSFDHWVYLLILNRIEGKPQHLLPKNIKSPHSKLAKLGLIAKGSHYSGATSHTDYHKTTLIGKWIAEVYGDEFTPVEDDFLIIVFKTLRRAAYFIKENVDTSNDNEN